MLIIKTILNILYLFPVGWFIYTHEWWYIGLYLIGGFSMAFSVAIYSQEHK